MKERILQDWWLFKNINKSLIHEQCPGLEILNFGALNSYENGPDFYDGAIRKDNLIWYGNIELHIRSSDWNRHKHQFDKAYNNVILHVVLDKDTEVFNQLGEQVLTVEVKPMVKKALFKGQNRPCSYGLKDLNYLVLISELETNLMNRFNRKAAQIKFDKNQKSKQFESVFYQMLFKSFGNKINSENFEELFQLVSPYLKIKSETKIILFGFSNLIHTCSKQEQDEWLFLQKKYQLNSLPGINWKTKGFYNASLPQKRLNQLVMILSYFYELDLYNVSVENWLYIRDLIIFTKKISKQQVDLIFINGICVFYWWFSIYTDSYKYKELVIDLLIKLPAEQNSILSNWINNRILPQNAFDSQALLELSNQKCTFTKCLDCKIGQELLWGK